MGSLSTEQAFAQYVLPEIDLLYRVARTLTFERADAEDLVQDTLVRAYNAIDRFDGRYPRAWLLTIMRNLNRNRARRAGKIRFDSLDESPNDDGGDTGYDRIPDSRHGRPEDVIDVTFDSAVARALDSLGPPFRDAVELVDIGGLSYAEAAETLGVRIGTIMSRLHRARNRIRASLDDAGFIPGVVT